MSLIFVPHNGAPGSERLDRPYLDLSYILSFSNQESVLPWLADDRNGSCYPIKKQPITPNSDWGASRETPSHFFTQSMGLWILLKNCHITPVQDMVVKILDLRTTMMNDGLRFSPVDELAPLSWMFSVLYYTRNDLPFWRTDWSSLGSAFVFGRELARTPQEVSGERGRRLNRLPIFADGLCDIKWS